MSCESFEVVLARLYTDPEFRREFLKNPQATLENKNLSAEEIADLLKIDKAGLIMAANSFNAKKEKRSFNRSVFQGLLARLFFSR